MRIRIWSGTGTVQQSDRAKHESDAFVTPGDTVNPQEALPFEEMHREMERMLEEAGRWQRPQSCSWERLWRPRCNVYEAKDCICVLVDLAGINKEAIDVRATVRSLFLRGERETPTPKDAERCHHMEIPAGVFEREIQLPAPIAPERVTVSYDNGWLQVHMPKAERMRVEVE
jgi:HSP20 family protein